MKCSSILFKDKTLAIWWNCWCKSWTTENKHYEFLNLMHGPSTHWHTIYST